MTGNVLQIGPRAILLAIEEILKTHLQTAVTAWETAQGYAAGYIKVPSVTTGYALSRVVKQEEAPSCRIYVDNSGALEDRAAFPGAASRMGVTNVRVKFRTFAEVAADSDEQCDCLAECAKGLIEKYYRAYFTEIRAANVNVRVDWRGASIREQFQTVGMTYRGRASQNTHEEIDLLCVVTHRQAYAVSYTKDLPP